MPRLTRSLLAVPLALVLAATPASAAVDRVDLVTGSMPEGISAGPGSTFFAGARSDGAVYVGDAATGSLRTLVRGRSGEVAVGLLHDPVTQRLWVAGGATGDVTAYDARTGKVLYEVSAGGGRFLNDVAITRDAVYVTDSRRAELVVVPTPGGALPAKGTVRTLRVTGDYVQPSGFGLNGVRVLPSGELLVVSGGVLYAVDTATGVADRLEQSGRALTAGDGLVLDGSTLYVVNGYGGDEVAVLRLAPDGGSTQAVGLLTDAELDRPTTGALVGGDLYVVNGRFGTLATQPDAPVYVTRLSTK